MDNNKLLQTLRQALDMTEEDMAEIFRQSGCPAGLAELEGLLAERGAADFTPCSDLVLRHFLEGLIISERGPREDGAVVTVAESPLSNNQILKKLRIAFNFKEIDMLSVFEEGGASLSASELGALFRNENNKHYRPCSDELLENFLSGLMPSLDD